MSTEHNVAFLKTTEPVKNFGSNTLIWKEQ